MKIRHTMVIIIGLIVVAGFLACQSGKDDTRGETGSVAILLTDKPTGDFDKVLITIDKIELLSENGRVTLPDDSKQEQEVNLLDLEDHGILFSLSSGIPAGPYSKVRLHVSNLKLEKGESVIVPKLPANGKIDLNPRMTFFVDPGEPLVLEIDVDAQYSIHVVETGSSKHIFRPVVFVRVVDGIVGGKIIKVSGFATNMRDDAFTLCDIDSIRPAASLSQADDLSKCVDVHIGSSSFFDEQGDPVGYDQIEEEDFITLFGKIHIAASPLDGPENEPPLELQAFVVGKGNLLKFTGIIGSSLDGNDQFAFHIDPPGQDLSEGSIHVQYWEGTKIFSTASDLLDNSSISDGTFATVYGIFDLTEPNLLSAEAILIGDTASPETLSGTISGNILSSEMTFDLTTDTGTVCVKTPAGSNIMMTTQDASHFEINQAAHTEDLQIGDGVTLLGSYDSVNPACFKADSVFAYRESQG